MENACDMLSHKQQCGTKQEVSYGVNAQQVIEEETTEYPNDSLPDPERALRIERAQRIYAEGKIGLTFDMGWYCDCTDLMLHE